MLDEMAKERITELEAQLEEAYQLIDLLYEDINDLREENKAVKGQLQLVKQDRSYAA